MARLSIKALFIPRKTQKVEQPNYLTDMQTIETWALAILKYLQNNGILEITSVGGSVTITNPFGPVTNLEAAGGITDVTSADGTINVANPTGPTVDLGVHGYPFLQYSDTSAHRNTAYGNGTFASINLSVSTDNTALGYNALNTMGSATNNTAVGSTTLQRLTSGGNNTAVGGGAAFRCTTGSHNTAIGSLALEFNTTGNSNTAIGDSAAIFMSSGSFNTAIGEGTSVGSGGSGRTAIGVDSTGTSAAANNDDDMTFGTARTVVNLLNNTTGAGTTGVGGANNPATTPGSIQGWIKIRDGSGTIGYIPYWR